MRFKFLIILLFVCTSTLASDLIEGTVIKVSDGDTIHVQLKKKDVKIRLYGIDTPESKQEYGKEAMNLLAKLINDKTVTVYVVDKDKYDRLVGKVFYQGQYINLIMVQKGAAWWYKKYAKKDIEFKIAEKWAKDNKLGLWEENKPTPPWKWRKKNK